MTPKPKTPEDYPLHIPLPGQANWPRKTHLLEKTHELALTAACNAGRPLLVRGEPGMGKSQLARAAAVLLKRPFLPFVVTASTEPTDLLWRFDAVARLAEAQLCAARSDTDSRSIEKHLDPKRFLTPGPLWWAINWKSAHTLWNETNKGRKPAEPWEWKWEEEDEDWKIEETEWCDSRGCVVLIDEIDKADAEVPNSMLEVLGNWSFSVPHLVCTDNGRVTNEIAIPEGYTKPLVIITTNEERELPAAFIRRCLVLEIVPPSNSEGLKEWFLKCGHAHYGGYSRCSEPVLSKAAEIIEKDRSNAISANLPAKPGLAEYLDLVGAVVNTDDSTPADDLLDEVKQFVVGKHQPKTV